MPHSPQTAFLWGAKAARMGLRPSDNPYASPRERGQWEAGYEAENLPDRSVSRAA